MAEGSPAPIFPKQAYFHVVQASGTSLLAGQRTAEAQLWLFSILSSSYWDSILHSPSLTTVSNSHRDA